MSPYGSGAMARPLTVLMNGSLAEGSNLCINLTLERIQLTIDRSRSCRSSVKSLSAQCTRWYITFFQQHNLLSVYQSGSRSLHSTSTCLTDVTSIDKGQLTGQVFLDLTNAFDTLHHSVLLDKLASLRFSKAAIQWFKAYLTERTQSVVVNRSTSDPQSISFSDPQGSWIGPLLFIIYINDVPSVVLHCKIQLYAYDTLLHVSSSSISDIESMLSEDLKHIIEWLNNNFLYLNCSKSKVMLIGSHQRLALVDSFTVRAGDTVLS